MASGIGLGLVLAGTAAVVAAPFTGGASIALFGGTISASSALLAAGTVAVMAGGVLNAQSMQPEPVSQVSRQTGTTNDAETPWEWVYGEVIKGSALTWQGVGGDENEFSGADFVVACHPCDALLGVQIGEWYFPVVTDQAGTDTANGRGIYLNTGQVITDDWPADWYVVVDSSFFVDNPQDDKDSPDYHHMGLKWSPGNRTATEPFMTTRFGTKYSSRARKYIGHTVVSMITRVHDEMGTGVWEPVLFHIRGKNNLLDHTGANPTYRNFCSNVFADICQEWLGIPVTDIVSINPGQTFQDVSQECANTTWVGASGAARYDFNGVIRDDMEPTEVLQMICDEMCGGYSERGDKIAIYTGTVKPVWADGPLTYDDVVAVGDATAITIVPPDEDAWANTLVPHFVVMRPNNEDGQNQLYGKMEPARQDVTTTTYVTEDDGVILRQDIKFPACIRSRQAKDRAWTVLRQMRLGASMDVLCKKRASVLERGDVVACNFPDFFPNGTLWQVATKQMILGPDTFAVRLGMVRYEHAIYDHTLNPPTEDAIGVVPKRRSSIVPLITGLAADTIDSNLQSDGDIVCDVSVTWDLVTNFLVRSAGDIRIAWRKQSATRWRATTVPGDEIETVIPGLLQATTYLIRARAEGVATAGRVGKPKGKWTNSLNFTPDSGLITPGRPGTAILSDNEVHNPHFKQKRVVGGVTTAVGWEYQSAASGSTTWDDTGGRHGSESTKIEVVSHTRNIRPDDRELVAAEVGQRWRFRFWRRVTQVDAPDNARVRINVLYYGAAGASAFLSSVTVAERNRIAGPVGYQLVTGHHTVPSIPADIKFMRMQASAVFVDGPFTVRFDAFQQKRVLGADGPVLLDTELLNEGDENLGQSWEVIRSITVSTPGDDVVLQVSFSGRIGDAGNMTTDTTAQMRVRVLRYDEDGTSNQTTILPETLIGGPVNESVMNLNPQGWDQFDRRTVDAVDVSGVAGVYIYRAEFSTNNTDAKAAVRERSLSWKLAEQGTS